MDAKTAVIALGMATTKMAAIQAEIDEIKRELVDSMVIKGRVDSVADLADIDDPEAGWVYLVGLAADDNKAEYVYTEAGTWEFLGMHVTVDPAPTQSSTNPVSSGGVYTALAGKVTEGSGYAVVNGIRVYVSGTTPTGDIPEGSIGIGF